MFFPNMTKHLLKSLNYVLYKYIIQYSNYNNLYIHIHLTGLYVKVNMFSCYIRMLYCHFFRCSVSLDLALSMWGIIGVPGCSWKDADLIFKPIWCWLFRKYYTFEDNIHFYVSCGG